MDENHLPTMQACSACQAGQMHLRYITYYTWLGDELITVTNFPAWVCDLCGKRDYDPHAMNQLNLLLNPNAGRPMKQRPHIRPRKRTTKNPRAATS
jgi:YgiT-type zinc finger domain-containing protein